jgi:GntR family transcriptional repressor for pyruvate dehydrogenase complex
MAEISDLKSKRKHIRSYRVIVEEIRKLIREGQLSPGDHLLPERQLAEKLQVSRPTLREALTALESIGLVEITRNGAKISETNMEDLVEPLALSIVRERDNVFHLLELRKIIEIQMVRLAAERATDIDLLRLREINLTMRHDIESKMPNDDSDVAFHLAIAASTRNPLITDVMTMISGLMRDCYGPSRKKLVSDPGRARLYVRQHLDIYEAIAAGDPDLAEEMMKDHFFSVDQDLTKIIEEETLTEGDGSGGVTVS